MLMPRKLTVSEERGEDSRLECKGVEGCEHEWGGCERKGVRGVCLSVKVCGRWTSVRLWE